MTAPVPRAPHPAARPPGRPVAALALSLTAVMLAGSSAFAEDAAVDDLSDLSSRVQIIVTLIQRDTFQNEFQYEVTIKNQAARPLGSLVLVLAQITDLAGKEALDRMEIRGEDGTTADGKPFFRVPLEGGLQGYAVSRPVIVRLRNPAYTVLFTPSFQVRGRLLEDPAAERTEALIDLLGRKGVLAEEDRQSLGPHQGPSSAR